jgi:replicative DNA helicase
MSNFQNHILEATILASAYDNSRSLHDFGKGVRVEDFTHPSLRAFAEQLFFCAKKGYRPDISLILKKIPDIHHNEILSRCFAGVGTHPMIKDQCQKLTELTRARDMLSTVEKLALKAKASTDAADYIAEAYAELNGVDEFSPAGQLENITTAGAHFLENLMEVKAGKRHHLKTGFPSLDNLTGGFRGGELIVTAARPAVGKTSFALSMAINQVLAGKKVAMFSFEMSKAELLENAISQISELPYSLFRNNVPLTSKEMEVIKDTASQLKRLGFFVNDNNNSTLMDIELEARRFHRKNGIDMIVIDYIGLIRPEIASHRENRHLFIQECSIRMKALAKELNIPINLIVQLNRDTHGKRPNMANLAESSQIEKDADYIFLIHQPDPDNKNERIVILDKGRAVQCRDFWFNFTHSKSFTEMDEETAKMRQQQTSDKKTKKDELW